MTESNDCKHWIQREPLGKHNNMRVVCTECNLYSKWIECGDKLDTFVFATNDFIRNHGPIYAIMHTESKYFEGGALGEHNASE